MNKIQHTWNLHGISPYVSGESSVLIKLEEYKGVVHLQRLWLWFEWIIKSTESEGCMQKEEELVKWLSKNQMKNSWHIYSADFYSYSSTQANIPLFFFSIVVKDTKNGREVFFSCAGCSRLFFFRANYKNIIKMKSI